MGFVLNWELDLRIFGFDLRKEHRFGRERQIARRGKNTDWGEKKSINQLKK